MLDKIWREGNSLAHWWEYTLIQPLWRTVWIFLFKKLRIRLPCDGAIPLLWAFTLRKSKATCASIFSAALFAITITGNQPRSSL